MKISPISRFTPLAIILSMIVSLGACSSAGSANDDANKANDVKWDALSKTVAELDLRYAGGVQTLSTADDAIVQTDAASTALEAWYLSAQKACYQRFFVNNCLHDIIVRHIDTKTKLKNLNVEAKRFQRKVHIDELDKNLEERQAQDKAKNGE